MSKEPSEDPEKLVSVTFRIHQRQVNALRLLYKRTGCKQADLVRAIFDRFLKPTPKQS